MRTLLIVFAVIFGTLFFLWNFVFFVVDQREQALVVELGNAKRTVTEPGLYLMIPFVQNVVYFEKRILEIDAPATESLSKDQKRVVVSAFARYRIVNPLLFYQAVNNISQAEQRIGTALSSNIRGALASRPFQALLSTDRNELMQAIRKGTNDEAQSWGIEIVDVRIRRADLPQANSEAIFSRMKTARQKEAAEIRAKGDQAAQVIRAEADKKAAITIAEAQKQAEILRGQGDGERNRIYAEAYSKDPSFFEFYRSMQAYATSMSGTDTTMVLTPDSSFFRYFSQGANPSGAKTAAPPPAPAAPQ